MTTLHPTRPTDILFQRVRWLGQIEQLCATDMKKANFETEVSLRQLESFCQRVHDHRLLSMVKPLSDGWLRKCLADLGYWHPRLLEGHRFRVGRREGRRVLRYEYPKSAVRNAQLNWDRATSLLVQDATKAGADEVEILNDLRAFGARITWGEDGASRS